VADNLHGLQSILTKLYKTMMPRCSQLVDVGRGIAGFAATWWIGSRVWKSIANAEPIDFYPLLRPFAIGLCITFFPTVMLVINGVLQPTVDATESMVQTSNEAVEKLLKQKEDAIKTTDIWKMYVGNNDQGDKQKWLKYTHGKTDKDPDIKEGFINGFTSEMSFQFSRLSYQFQNNVKAWISQILQILYEAAGLCVNTIRTFQMVVLTILGPLVFGLATFDGLQHTLTAWLAKFINIFLWLPVCNIFSTILGMIQEEMLKLDLSQLAVRGDTFYTSTDLAYMIFLIIGIVGYTTVPTVAGYIVNAGGAGPLVQKMTSMLSMMSPGSAVGGLRSAVDAKKSFDDGKNHGWGTGLSGGLGRALGGQSESEHQKKKIAGNSDK
ncbi:conjugative transposon protein TraJ, partial [Pedobacter sp.]|uniref:conjugative transposon protein TraJ n=1 Tax=Pedobacter sp. TaxID=1411316 RepID=UPI002BDC2A9E